MRPVHVIFKLDDDGLMVGGFGSRPPHANHRAEVVDEHVSSNDPTCPIPCCVECGEWWPCPEAGTVVSSTPAHWYVAADSAHAYWDRENVALVLAWDRRHCKIGQDWLGHFGKIERGKIHGLVTCILVLPVDGCDGYLPGHGLPGTLILLDEKGEVMKTYPSKEVLDAD